MVKVYIYIFKGWNHTTQQGVSHTVALPFTLKNIFKGKRGIMKIQIFHHAKI